VTLFECGVQGGMVVEAGDLTVDVGPFGRREAASGPP
jgi:hypothetical protein